MPEALRLFPATNEFLTVRAAHREQLFAKLYPPFA